MRVVVGPAGRGYVGAVTGELAVVVQAGSLKRRHPDRRRTRLRARKRRGGPRLIVVLDESDQSAES